MKIDLEGIVSCTITIGEDGTVALEDIEGGKIVEPLSAVSLLELRESLIEP